MREAISIAAAIEIQAPDRVASVKSLNKAASHTTHRDKSAARLWEFLVEVDGFQSIEELHRRDRADG